MIDAMKYWVKKPILMVSIDLASWVEVDFWQQAKPEVEKIKPLFFREFDELENPDYGKFLMIILGLGCTKPKISTKRNCLLQNLQIYWQNILPLETNS